MTPPQRARYTPATARHTTPNSTAVVGERVAYPLTHQTVRQPT